MGTDHYSFGPSIKVLDHGFVTLLNLAGPFRRPDRDVDASDRDPAMTARMSFNNFDEERTEEQDLKLCGYLIKNRHSTPLEMIECWFEMKMPIFAARQFIRHRTVTVNEVSARYVTLPEEWYIPSLDYVGVKSAKAKQGRTIREMTDGELLDAEWFRVTLDEDCRAGYAKYLAAIDRGIAPELARCFLHVNHYTHWVWKQNLHNIMHCISLRDHSHAQLEAQDFAQAIDTWLRKFLPHSMDLYDKHRRLE